MPPQRFYEYRIKRVSCVAKESKGFKTWDTMDNSGSVTRFLRKQLLHHDREHFFVLHYDVRMNSTGFELVAVGQLGQVEVRPSEVFRAAILAGSIAIVLAHNHPSGDVSPSEEDDDLTRRMIDAGQLVGIQVLDHVVFSLDKHYGYREHERVFRA